MNAYAIECRTCGEPSDKRECPTCANDRNRYNGAVLRFRPRTSEDERDGGRVNGNGNGR